MSSSYLKSAIKKDFIKWYSSNLKQDYLKWIDFSPLNIYHRYIATGHLAHLSWIRLWMSEIHAANTIDTDQPRLKKIKAMAIINNLSQSTETSQPYLPISEFGYMNRSDNVHEKLFKQWLDKHPDYLTTSTIGYEKMISDFYTLETSYIVDEVLVRKWISEWKVNHTN